MTRRGFTLVEMVVALLLAALVSSIIYRLLVTNHHAYRASTQRIDQRQGMRVAATVLTTEMRELDARDGDIRSMSRTEIAFRATRQLAMLCDSARNGVLAVRESLLFGTRDFNPDTDSLLIYLPAGRWAAVPLTGVGAGTCADGGGARLLSVPAAHAHGLGPGTPLRGFELVAYRLYRGGDGLWHIGLLDSRGGAVQPLVGPVDPDGLVFEYRDASGTITADPRAVTTIEIRLRSGREQTATTVALRNNSRP